MASTRRPRALPAYLCALLAVCALATSAFAASTFHVTLSFSSNVNPPPLGSVGTVTDNTSATQNPATTNVILGDTVVFDWTNGGCPSLNCTHSVTQTTALGNGIASGFDSGINAFNASPGLGGFQNAFTVGPTQANVAAASANSLTAAGNYFYECFFHGPPMDGTVVVAANGPLDHFALIIPSGSTQTAGTGFTVNIQARDRNDNIVPGAISVTITNPTGSGAVFTPASPITLASDGTGSFTANIHTSGSQQIVASASGKTGTAFITVNPAAATHYLVTAPATATAGQNTNFTVTAQDQFNNTATGYAGTVHFTSSDGAAVKPADSTLVSGTKGFGVTFNTPGSQTIVATDTVTGSITGSDVVTVNSANCPAADKTFTNAAAISIPDQASAVPYPSNITVSGFTGNQVVGKVTVTLFGFNHSFPSDIDIMLVGPGGQKLVLMSDAVANGIPKTPVDITFDDAATQAIPLNTSALAAGTYLPTAYSNFRTPTFNAPAPAAPWPTPQTEGTATLANTFNGLNPNGTWSLYIQDNIGGDFGAVNGGWKLTITPGFSASNSNSISFNTTPSASPYPSNINVSGLIGNVSTVTVTLKNLNDTCIPDLALLLVGPQGQKFVPMGFVGNCFVTNTNFTLVLDDAAPSLMPSYPGSLAAGTYRPSSYEVINGFNHAPPSFPGAPGLPYQLPAADGSATFTSTFGGIDPNGTWGLYVLPQFNTDSGSFSSGWTLVFTLKCPAPTNCTVGSSQNPSSFLQAVTFTATVTSGAGTPTGNVTFTDTTTATTLASNVALNGAGQASAGPFTNLSVATHNIVANYSDGITFDVTTSPPTGQVVNKANTATVLVSSVNPTTFNQSTTFTATVTGTFGGTPTGTITFKDGATTLATQAVNGSRQATLTIQTLTVGNHPITAVYNGDGNYNLSPASNAVNQVVNKASTTSVVVPSVNPSTFGQAIVFTGTVSSTNGIVPTGTVNFLDGVTVIASNVGLNGSAQASSGLVSNLIAGGHNITIVYSGDGNFTGSTSPVVTQTVNKASTTVAVSSSANPSTFGVGVTLTGTISIGAPGGGTPTGTITFKDGAATLGTGAVQPNKKATINTSALLPGAHSITAVYGGDSNFIASPTSPVFTQNVNQATTTTTLFVSRPTVFFRQKLDISANVVSSSGAPLAGNVTFTDNGKVIGIVAPNTPPLSITLGTLGNHTIVATYGGDPNQTGSSSDDSGTTANVQQSPHPATPNQP